MQNSYRRIMVLQGDREWCHRTACALIGTSSHDDIIWIGDTIPDGLSITPFVRQQQILGDEYGIAVFDGWSGFDPDLFGAASGTVRGGGALLLLLPPLEEWVRRPDPAQQRIAAWPHTPATLPNHFIARTIQVLQRHAAVEWHAPHEPLPEPLRIAAARTITTALARTADQQQAIAAIHRVACGHRHRPLVLMADRGRGKSAALGIAAAELLAQGVQQIIVTAPHRNAVSSLFEHVIGADIPPTMRAGEASTPIEQARFIPPDELLRHHYPCDLLLVDEAAAIPAPMLRQLLKQHARIVFATTVHGYEGSGRGFALRFFKVLETETPGWRLLEMSEPIRWMDGDPLERLTYDLLLLDAEPAADHVIAAASAANVRCETLDSAELSRNEDLLSELFGLLVLAHYRTTPLDLRLLLDSPYLTLHVARYQNHLAGAAITLREGGIDAALAAQIYSGERRPRGHLAPQSLAFHCGLPEAPQLVTDRIMRIAVHTAALQRGIGSALIKHAAAHSRDEGADYLSTSFGATPELLRFWQHSAFLPVRVGLNRQASSGTHSALLMRPLTSAAMALFSRARRRFLAYLPLMLSDPLHNLDPALVTPLLNGELSATAAPLDEDDWRDLSSFATTRRGYESCLGAIYKLTLDAIANPLMMNTLAQPERHLLIAKVLQRQPWSEASSYCQTRGREETVNVLRQIIGRLVRVMAPEYLERFSGAGKTS